MIKSWNEFSKYEFLKPGYKIKTMFGWEHIVSFKIIQEDPKIIEFFPITHEESIIVGVKEEKINLKNGMIGVNDKIFKVNTEKEFYDRVEYMDVYYRDEIITNRRWLIAYSDYGGYAYRNGERVIERSDWTYTPDGGFESPGMWPGFTAVMQGMSADEAVKIRNNPGGHAVLGSGPVYVTMYKQSSMHVYYDDTELFSPDLYDPDEHDFWGCIRFMKYDFRYRYAYIDNYYQFAQLVEPDGTTWVGFSGYGVGAGLEDSPYHPFDTNMIVDEMKRSFPRSFGDVDNVHISYLSPYYEAGEYNPW